MSFFTKVLTFTVLLALLFAVGFTLWGERFDVLFSQQACAAWFSRIKPYAWLLGIALLVADLVLPIPATGIMAALGSVYGLWLGTLFSIIGSAAAGLTGYGLARFAGRTATRYLADQEEIDRFQQLFNSWGGAAIIGSRAMPIMPEVMTILAGFAGMNFIRFSMALMLGTVPTCFLFVYLGSVSWAEPVWGLAAAVFIPLLIWPIFLRFGMPVKQNLRQDS